MKDHLALIAVNSETDQGHSRDLGWQAHKPGELELVDHVDDLRGREADLPEGPIDERDPAQVLKQGLRGVVGLVLALVDREDQMFQRRRLRSQIRKHRQG